MADTHSVHYNISLRVALPTPTRSVDHHGASSGFFIRKLNFSVRNTPGVSERMWSVHLDATISGEYQTI
jgi:hypothetical protein